MPRKMKQETSQDIGKRCIDTNQETLKMSEIQRGTVISHNRNHLKDFTSQTANIGAANKNIPSTKSHNELNHKSQFTE